MPQEESGEVREFRRQMRAGRAPLLEALKQAYRPYLLAKKSLDRKNSEIREQVGMLSSEFDEKCRLLRESSRKADTNPAAVIDLYKGLSQQATAVAVLIEKELPGLTKLYEPVAKAFAAYEKALKAYNDYMQQWVGKLPESDLSGRALELALDPIEKSLR
ncbi:MAG TPA: hypothetical protein VKR83_13335 [Ktedonobacteraceae bacterium]|nr:hypothetical protein [Ktedonobacteraceae bacterium]